MKTMSLIKFGLGHVDSVETDTPVPGPTEVLVKVLACGVCRTDLTCGRRRAAESYDSCCARS